MLAFLVRVAIMLALIVTPVTLARAGQATDQLKVQIDRVVKMIDDPELKKENRALDRRKSVRKIAEDIFDFGETAKRSLGRHWSSRSPAEREEFTGLFADLLERSYISKIELFNGERIQFVGDSADGDQTIVRTKIVTKQGTEVPVDYRMLKKGDRWLVYDVIIEGVSLVANYRTQFNKIIQTSSYQELVKKMKTKQEEFLDQEKQQQTKRTS
ncbi:MAG: organic solvent tolerance ABC transporter substrate-binding protein [Candidatus Rokuibacteriota bacterium]|nr:MAG: organic solvent tolerance ABC transporter substrate-binding protein [Candidatus Rokubacteria bacterium]